MTKLFSIENLTKAQIAFGVATTQTEVDPDRRWEAIKIVSEFLGRLRLASDIAPSQNDLVKRLREQAEWNSDGHGALHGEAADEIERLSAVFYIANRKAET